MRHVEVLGHKNWLTAYLKYAEEAESPEIYKLWAALSIVASALRRNVWLDMGVHTVWPHMFVILTGQSGKLAKSTTIRMARNILMGVENIHLGPDAVTKEELIVFMSKLSAQESLAAVTLHSTELSSLIEPSGLKMIQFLTDIYDGDVSWQYHTKGSGRYQIDNPTLNILAGTTPSWLAEGMPTNVVEHGFTSRVVFVYAEELSRINSKPASPDEKLVDALQQDLQHMALLEGPMEFTDAGFAEYDKYYNSIMNTLPDDYRVESFHWRVARAHILKVAMLISVTERDDLLITETDMKKAFKILNAVQRDMGKSFSAVGKFEYASDAERILRDIQSAPEGLSTQAIYSKNMAVGPDAVRDILVALIRAGKIVTAKTEKGLTLYLPVDRIST